MIRAIGVSHTACKYEFRKNIRSHSWSVFFLYIDYIFNLLIENIDVDEVVGASSVRSLDRDIFAGDM